MSGSNENTTWPPPNFPVSVTGWPGTPVFQEVVQLNMRDFSVIKMPGNIQFVKIELMNGVFVKDSLVLDWLRSTSTLISMNKPARSEKLVVTFFDHTSERFTIWNLTNAWVMKLTGVDIRSDSNQVAVESIEVSYEGLTTSFRG